MFKHVFVNRLKILLRNRVTLFWTLLFPLALATFFHFAFANLTSSENFKIVNLAVVNNESFNSSETFKTLISSLSNGDDKMFNTTYADLETSKKLLSEGDISGYINVDNKINVVISSNGINQTIIKSVVDNYYQLTSTANHLVTLDHESMKNGILNELGVKKEYFRDKSSSSTDVTVIYFYTLIGMVSMFGAYFGITTVNETEGNLSKKGARICVSPVNKMTFLITSLLVALTIHFSEILIVLSYLTLVLKVNFGNQLLYVIIVSFIGALTGISFGTCISVASKKSENTKIGIVTALSMTLSFLSGMMSTQIKYLVDHYAPIISKINPVNLITDALYSLYYYDSHTRFFQNIFYLIIFVLVTLGISYLFMRRKNYDSI